MTISIANCYLSCKIVCPSWDDITVQIGPSSIEILWILEHCQIMPFNYKVYNYISFRGENGEEIDGEHLLQNFFMLQVGKEVGWLRSEYPGRRQWNSVNKILANGPIWVQGKNSF